MANLNIAITFARKIRDKSNILSIVLFGSVATGDDTIESDIDIAIIYDQKDILDRRSRIESMKKTNSDVERIFSEYSEREDEINQYMPAVRFLNRSAPSIQNLLVLFSRMDLKDITFDQVTATARKNNQLSMSAAKTAFFSSFSDFAESPNLARLRPTT